MYFIGGTNHGRWDGGIPSEGARYHEVPTFDLAGHRYFRREMYHRAEPYWRHESLSDEQFAQAVAEFEAASPRRRVR